MEFHPSLHSDKLSGIQFYQYIHRDSKQYLLDVIIVGGSYAGISAALTLGIAGRSVLVIDSGKASNYNQHMIRNFYAHEGDPAFLVAKKAKQQLLKYENVRFAYDKVVEIRNEADVFIVLTKLGSTFKAKKIIGATGVIDKMLLIQGFTECWDISIFQNIYYGGNEIRQSKHIGILAKGQEAKSIIEMVYHWKKNIFVFTNGKAGLSTEDLNHFKRYGIHVIENRITLLQHNKGKIREVQCADKSIYPVEVMISKVPFFQSTDIYKQLGCAQTPDGLIQVDSYQQTSIKGIYAAGDNCYAMRSISSSVAAGTNAGMFVNKSLAEETFRKSEI
jgi:thioredoxin reductase